MEWDELLRQRRTVRVFDQKPLTDEDFRSLLEAARLASAAANNQKLRYVAVRSPELVAKLFPLTRYAARVAPHRDPVPGVSAPTAFLAVTAAGDGTAPLLHADAGAAIQSIEFAGWSRGIGCCWLGAFDREAAAKLLALPAGMSVLYLVALGYRAETPVQENIGKTGAVGYYLDDKNVLHVPKYEIDAITDWK